MKKIAGRQRGRNKIYNSRMPIIIQHPNPASAHYYENKDVSIAIARVFKKKKPEFLYRVDSNIRIVSQSFEPYCRDNSGLILFKTICLREPKL